MTRDLATEHDLSSCSGRQGLLRAILAQPCDEVLTKQEDYAVISCTAGTSTHALFHLLRLRDASGAEGGEDRSSVEVVLVGTEGPAV